MTMPLPTQSAFQRFVGSLTDLLKAGHGHASFVIDEAGELAHTATVVTVQMTKGETLESFHQRLRRDFGLRPGDTIEILDNRGRVDTARLHLRPRV